MREKSFRVNNILDFKYVFSLRLSASARDIAFKNKNDGSLGVEKDGDCLKGPGVLRHE